MEPMGGLPGHAALADGETLVRKESFGISIARFFMKTKLALTSERLAGESPNTSFWLISKGANEFDYPLGTVTAVATYTTRRTFRLVAGLALVAAGLWNGGTLWFLAIVGALILLTAFRVVLSVTNDVLLHHNMEISLLDRGAAQRFARQISVAIAARPPIVRSHWFSPEVGA
ncbi:MAG: YgaP family membrane protein [Chloroflexota bacterium]